MLPNRYNNVKDKVSVSHIKETWRRVFHGKRVLFLICGGGFSPSDMVNKFVHHIEDRGSAAGASSSAAESGATAMVLFKNQQIRVPIHGLTTTAIHVTWVLPIRMSDHKQTVRMDMLKMLLCDGFESRLVSKLRRELGLVYFVSANVYKYSQQVLFQIITEVDERDRVREVKRLITDSIGKFEKVSMREISAVKNTLRYLLHRESYATGDPEFWAAELQTPLLTNTTYLGCDRYLSIVDKTTPNDLETFVTKNFGCRVTIFGTPSGGEGG